MNRPKSETESQFVAKPRFGPLPPGGGRDRPPAATGARAAYFKQAIHEKLIEHKHYIAQHGDDMPTLSGWKWGTKGPAGARSTSTEGDKV